MPFNRYEENLIANLRGLPQNFGLAIYGRCGRPYNPRGSREYLSDKGATPPCLPLKVLVDRFVEHYDLHHVRPETVLLRHWHTIIGGNYAQACRPKKILFNRKLLITVFDAVVRSELSFQRRSILKRLKQWPELETIEEIVLVATV